MKTISFLYNILSSSGRCVCCANATRHKLFTNAHAFICTECSQEIATVPQYIQGISPFYSTIFFYSIYEGLLQRIIPAYKYDGKLYYAPLLADCILFTFFSLVTTHYDYCIPVPQHIKKTRSRGLYHLGLLANYITKYTAIPTPRTYVKALRNYTSQQLLSREQRLPNLLNAFSITHSLTGKRILLLDDVITTGTTLTAVAKTLYYAGVQHIDCLAIAINKRGICV